MVTIIYSIRSEALENYLEVFGLFSEAERQDLDERSRVGLVESGQVEYVGCGSVGRGRVSAHGLRNRTEYYFLSL